MWASGRESARTAIEHPSATLQTRFIFPARRAPTEERTALHRGAHPVGRRVVAVATTRGTRQLPLPLELLDELLEESDFGADGAELSLLELLDPESELLELELAESEPEALEPAES